MKVNQLILLKLDLYFLTAHFEINGTNENPVRIFSSDSSGQGLHLIQGNNNTNINYLNL